MSNFFFLLAILGLSVRVVNQALAGVWRGTKPSLIHILEVPADCVDINLALALL